MELSSHREIFKKSLARRVPWNGFFSPAFLLNTVKEQGTTKTQTNLARLFNIQLRQRNRFAAIRNKTIHHTYSFRDIILELVQSAADSTTFLWCSNGLWWHKLSTLSSQPTGSKRSVERSDCTFTNIHEVWSMNNNWSDALSWSICCYSRYSPELEAKALPELVAGRKDKESENYKINCRFFMGLFGKYLRSPRIQMLRERSQERLTRRAINNGVSSKSRNTRLLKIDVGFDTAMAFSSQSYYQFVPSPIKRSWTARVTIQTRQRLNEIRRKFSFASEATTEKQGTVIEEGKNSRGHDQETQGSTLYRKG